MDFNPKRIEDPYDFIGDLYNRLVGLKTDLEYSYSKSDSLEYRSRTGLDMVEIIINWMESQQASWID